MADSSLLAGPSLRRLRKREGLTQATMAAALGISPSYLNLIERNQRPLSARVLVQVIEQFDFDPRTLREDEAIGGVDGLARRFSDKRFSDISIDREEIQEFLASSPQVAAAFARLYDQSGDRFDSKESPEAKSREAIERWQNHFTELDAAAEAVSEELRLSVGEISVALAQRLREKHQLSVRILPADVIPGQASRLDLHARQLQISEMLAGAGRRFQIARQVGALENREAIETVIAGARLQSKEAQEHFRSHILDYLAGALLMPYSRFMRACEQTAYDITVLRRRFAVNFEQLANRLTTLQRMGERGLPFFVAKLDKAGGLDHFIAGASGAVYPLQGARWPAWVPFAAFERPGVMLRQSVLFSEGEAVPKHWFTLATTIDGDGVVCRSRKAIVLGVEARFAAQMTDARGISLSPENAVRLGAPCSVCGSLDCLDPR